MWALDAGAGEKVAQMWALDAGGGGGSEGLAADHFEPGAEECCAGIVVNDVGP